MTMVYATPIPMPAVSNVFVTIGCHGRPGHKDTALWIVEMVRRGIAVFDCWLVVPVNRMGHSACSAAQLKTVLHLITLMAFAAFSVFWLKQAISWQTGLGFGFIAFGAALVFRGAAGCRSRPPRDRAMHRSSTASSNTEKRR